MDLKSLQKSTAALREMSKGGRGREEIHFLLRKTRSGPKISSVSRSLETEAIQADTGALEAAAIGNVRIRMGLQALLVLGVRE